MLAQSHPWCIRTTENRICQHFVLGRISHAQCSLRGNHASEAALRGSHVYSAGCGIFAQAENRLVLHVQVSPHGELRTSVAFGHQLGFVAESISITEEEAQRILESMTERPTPELNDVTVEGTKLIQAIESIARGRDLLTIRW